MLIRDLDLGEFNAFDNRRVEEIADGLTLRQGPQHPICEEVVLCQIKSGRPQRGSFGGGQAQEGSHFPRTCPGRRRWRTSLVLLATEVGGKWSTGTAQFLRGLAKARAKVLPMIVQERAKAAWFAPMEFDVHCLTPAQRHAQCNNVTLGRRISIQPSAAGNRSPDVAIPHYRDARVQHSPMQCPSTLHPG